MQQQQRTTIASISTSGKITAAGVILLTALSVRTGWAADDDPVLYRFDHIAIRIGAYSEVERLKETAATHLRQCALHSAGLQPDKPGIFGAATRSVFAALAACDVTLNLPRGSAAYAGAVTAALWRTLLPDVAPPDPADRAASLTLSFEATDFTDKPEWNFCQDTPGATDDRATAVASGAACINATDPCSMLTWGPRGATAGQGNEIQWILWKLRREAPELLATAFGSEMPHVERFLRLARPPATSCDGTSPTEHFMCAVWIDPRRRRSWEGALQALGASRVARRAYDSIYASHDFDGYKLAQYRELWLSLRLEPSEIDYAFFLDRATHIGSPPLDTDPRRAELGPCLASDQDARSRNAAARRCLSRLHPHATQPVDRRGRDIAYVRAAYPAGALSSGEIDTWNRHIPLDVTINFGLSDDRLAARKLFIERAPPPERPPNDLTDLNDLERGCSQRILKPLRSKP